MSTCDIWTLIFIVFWVVSMYLLCAKIGTLQNKLDEKIATAKAYDDAACKHNARAFKAEQKRDMALQTASVLADLTIRLIEHIEEMESKISQKKRKRDPNGRFAKEKKTAGETARISQ